MSRQTATSSNVEMAPSGWVEAGPVASSTKSDDDKGEISSLTLDETINPVEDAGFVQSVHNKPLWGRSGERTLDNRGSDMSRVQQPIVNLDPIPAWKRFLLSHCWCANKLVSKRVADK
jgi:hypothetical protein